MCAPIRLLAPSVTYPSSVHLTPQKHPHSRMIMQDPTGDNNAMCSCSKHGPVAQGLPPVKCVGVEEV